MKAPKPIWLLNYQNVDVSDELQEHVEGVTYTDVLKGASDELELTLQNRDRRWLKGWFPSMNDRVTAKIGYEGEALLDCGVFKVDQLDFTIGSDTAQLKCLAAAISKAVRTKQNRAFENTTLKEIADILTRELVLNLIGDIPDVQIARVTQSQTTVAFLHQLAEDYGCAFSIRGDNLVFFEIAKLDKAPPVATLDVTGIEPGAHFSAKAAKTYVACELTFFDAATKKTITVRVEAENARQKVLVDATDTSAPPTLPTATLKQGSTGDDVKKWQTFLASRGIDTGAIDGVFGTVTRAATITFQRQQDIAADGVAGSETYRAALSVGFGANGPTTHAEAAGNVLHIDNERVENEEQAKIRAKAKLDAANRIKATGSGITVMGNPRLVAGATLIITGIGNLSGKFTIDKSTHKCDRSSGYKTTIEVTGV